jgi:hypothetical protein
MKTKSIPFRQLFSTLFVLFVGLLFATVLQAWTGPTATPPGNNVSTLINEGATAQVKNAGLSVNALTSYGSDYVQNKVGVGTQSPVVALDVAGALKIGNGGEACTGALAGAMRYNVGTNIVEYCNGSAWGSL